MTFWVCKASSPIWPLPSSIEHPRRFVWDYYRGSDGRLGCWLAISSNIRTIQRFWVGQILGLHCIPMLFFRYIWTARKRRWSNPSTISAHTTTERWVQVLLSDKSKFGKPVLVDLLFFAHRKQEIVLTRHWQLLLYEIKITSSTGNNTFRWL